MRDGNIGRDVREYQVELGELIAIIDKKYNDVLKDLRNEDDLWDNIISVREIIAEGKGFINNKKNIGDVENKLVNLVTLKKSFNEARVRNDEPETRKYRNLFLSNSQDFISTLSELSNNLEQEYKITEIKQSDEITEIKQSDEITEIKQSDEITEIKQSDEITENVGKKAIVIGINNYQSPPDGKNLQGAENDAKEICKILKKNGFEIADNDLLLGDKATYRAISKSINDTFRKRVSYGTILFYFSGHGFTDENNVVYIAPYDIDPNDPYVCGISIEE